MFDAALSYGPRADRSTLEKHDQEAMPYTLAAVHRASNTDDAQCLRRIM